MSTSVTSIDEKQVNSLVSLSICPTLNPTKSADHPFFNVKIAEKPKVLTPEWFKYIYSNSDAKLTLSLYEILFLHQRWHCKTIHILSFLTIYQDATICVMNLYIPSNLSGGVVDIIGINTND